MDRRHVHGAKEDFDMTYGKGMIDNDVTVTLAVKAAK